MEQWQERSPPINVARVRFGPVAIPDVGCVCCWFSPCYEGFSPSSPVFLTSQKPTSPNSDLTKIEDPHENQLRDFISFIYYLFRHSNDVI